MFPRHEEDESKLIEGCISKDPAAWETFIKRYSGLISASISNRLKRYGFYPSREEADDIRQGVLASIWAGGMLESIRNRKSIACWLAIVSGNAALHYMREKSPGKGRKLISLNEDIEAETVANVTPDKNELSELIERSLGSLSPKERLIIKLNIFQNMEYREISDILRIPVGTVSSCIKRAKEKLKEGLKDFE